MKSPVQAPEPRILRNLEGITPRILRKVKMAPNHSTWVRKEVVKVNLEDGLYQARSGHLEKVIFEDDGTKKIRVPQAGFDAVVSVQKQMRKALNGHKPDVSLVAEAMLLAAAEDPAIVEKVRLHAMRVFSGSNP